MTDVDVCNAFGFLAAAATLCTFAQKRMLPMRLSAVAANGLFIVYGLLGPFYPVFLLHFVLLPLNLCRLYEEWAAAPTSLIDRWSCGQS